MFKTYITTRNCYEEYLLAYCYNDYVYHNFNTEEKYEELKKAVKEFTDSDLTLFYCISLNFTWEWTRDLLKDTKIMKRLIEIIEMDK